jgi:hypothetical protein
VRMNLSILLCSIIVVMFSGCGGCSYSFTGASVPPHLKTVAIPMFDDQSGFGDPQLREVLTGEVTRRFEGDGNLRLAERGNADSILEGVITQVRDEVAEVEGGQDRASRNRITISVKIVWHDLINREVIFEQTVSNWGEYELGGFGPADQQLGIEEAVKKLSEDILIATVARW